MWLLMVIHLALGASPHVQHTEIIEIMQSEQKCMDKIKEIFKEANERKQPIPSHVNMGCVPLNRREA